MNGGDRKDERLAMFMQQELHKFDILCFQELFSFLNTRPQRLLDKFFVVHADASNNSAGLFINPHHAATNAKANYFCTSYASFWENGFRPFDSGLFIISRYPIVEHEVG